jgi:hypothetical protein
MIKWYKEQKRKYTDWHKYIGVWIKDQLKHIQRQDILLIIIFIIFGILFLLVYTNRYHLYHGSYGDHTEQLYLFSAIPQSLAAIFALTFSLIMVALQHIGSNYTPRAFKLHTFSIYYFLFFAIFLSTIGFSIYLNGKFQKYPNSLYSIKIDILEILFFFALAFMIPFSVRSVRLMRPGDIILRLGWKITERRFNSYTIYKHKINHFLQSIFDMNKACIRRSDILTIEVGLNLFSKRIRLLARRCNNETSSSDIAISICNHYSDIAYYANENKSCNGCKIIIYSLNNIIDGYKASKYRSPIKVFFNFLKRIEIDIKRFGVHPKNWTHRVRVLSGVLVL